MSIPPEIEFEEFADGCRYRLPRRPGGKERRLALLPIGFGCLWTAFSLFWTVGVLVAAVVGVRAGTAAWYWLFFPLFGLPFVAVGWAILAGGLFAAIGHAEIELGQRRLFARERGGLARWTRSRPLAELSRLVLQAPPGAAPAAPAWLAAETKAGKRFHLTGGYPRALLAAVAEHLGRRAGLEVGEQAVLAAAWAPGQGGGPPLPDPAAPRDQSVRLAPAERVSSFVVQVVFTLFWNVFSFGFLGVMAFTDVFADDPPPPFAWIMMGGFALVGVALAAAAISRLLGRGRFHGAEVTVSIHPVRLGERFRVEYQQRARRRARVDRVTLRLVCRKRTVHRQARGSATVSEEIHAAEREIARNVEAASYRALLGHAEFEIPADGHPTFTSAQEGIEWLLETRVHVPRWPDHRQEFPLQVLWAEDGKRA